MEEKNMNKIKNIVVVGTLAIMTLLSSITASAYSNASQWTFNFDRRSVSGKDNHRFHTLDAGNVVIKGSWTLSDTTTREGELYVELYRRTLLLDKNFGSQNVGEATTYSTGDIYATYTVDKDSDEYYIKWTCYSDYVDKIGSGTIYNQ